MDEDDNYPKLSLKRDNWLRHIFLFTAVVYGLCNTYTETILETAARHEAQRFVLTHDMQYMRLQEELYTVRSQYDEEKKRTVEYWGKLSFLWQ